MRKKGAPMGQQLHKRLPQEFVEEVLEAFNEKRLTEERACELLGIQRARLYRLRRQWLRDRGSGREFALWNRKESRFHRFPDAVEDWLHQELKYIRTEAEVYRGRFNFAFLAELAEKEFQRVFPRNSLRLFALRHGYYHALPEEKGKVYTRFEVSGPGVLFQHDTSHHLWLPSTGRRHALLLTEDDYSRRVLGSQDGRGGDHLGAFGPDPKDLPGAWETLGLLCRQSQHLSLCGIYQQALPVSEGA